MGRAVSDRAAWNVVPCDQFDCDSAFRAIADADSGRWTCGVDSTVFMPQQHGAQRAIGADFGSADLHTTDLSNADFSDAKLTDVDLRGAKLINTNFTRAILVGADLMSANLDDAVLIGANLDYACWPLWGCSLHAKIDKRLFCQLLCHTMRLGQSIDDVEVQSLLNDPVASALANQFHHIIEYGKLK